MRQPIVINLNDDSLPTVRLAVHMTRVYRVRAWLALRLIAAGLWLLGMEMDVARWR